MVAKPGQFTRFDGSLLEAAAIEGARQSRSTRQQLEHWVRLGAALSAQPDGPSTRVRLALDGTIAQRDLSAEEASEFDAEVARRIADAVARADFLRAAPELLNRSVRRGPATGSQTRDVGSAP